MSAFSEVAYVNFR